MMAMILSFPLIRSKLRCPNRRISGKIISIWRVALNGANKIMNKDTPQIPSINTNDGEDKN